MPFKGRPEEALDRFEEELAAEARAAIDVVEPPCAGGGPHRWEIGARLWRCIRCGFERPPRRPKQRTYTTGATRARPKEEGTGGPQPGTPA